MQTDRSLRTCLSRVLPSSHEARSKSKRRATLPERRCSEEASQDVYADFKSVGIPACNARKKRQNETRSQLTAVKATMTRETDIAEHVNEKQRAKEKPIFRDSTPRCCKLPIRGSSAPTANQRSGAVLSGGVGGGQKRTTES